MEQWRFTVSDTRTGETWQHETDANTLTEAAQAFLAHARQLASWQHQKATRKAVGAFLATSEARQQVRARYRQLRALQWGPAQPCYRTARAFVATQHAMAAGAVSFDWRHDQDYETDDCDPAFAEQERRNLASGEWTAQGCVASTPADDHAASLWGIVTGWDVLDQLYRDQVEAELATEAGILPDDVWR